MSVQMILKQGDKVVDKDLMSLKAAKDLIRQVLQRMIPEEEVLDELICIVKSLMQGKTIEIKNPEANTAFIFQLKRNEKVIH